MFLLTDFVRYRAAARHQEYAHFLHAHDVLMSDHIVPSVGEQLPSAESRLVRRPADGTANSARIMRIETTSVPGLTLLHLVASDALKPSAATRGSAAESGAESGIESMIEESDADERAADGALVETYALPVLARQFCDVDAHLIPLKMYLDGLKRAKQLSHVAVPFAADEGAATHSRPQEVLWQGRVFDNTRVHDPEQYPKSLYKSQHVVWYRCLARSKANSRLDRWVFDDEQTDVRCARAFKPLTRPRCLPL